MNEKDVISDGILKLLGIIRNSEFQTKSVLSYSARYYSLALFFMQRHNRCVLGSYDRDSMQKLPSRL